MNAPKVPIGAPLPFAPPRLELAPLAGLAAEVGALAVPFVPPKVKPALLNGLAALVGALDPPKVELALLVKILPFDPMLVNCALGPPEPLPKMNPFVRSIRPWETTEVDGATPPMVDPGPEPLVSVLPLVKTNPVLASICPWVSTEVDGCETIAVPSLLDSAGFSESQR